MGKNIGDDKRDGLRCSFCGKILESGRYSRFDDDRLICAECDKTSVREESELETAVKNVRKYLEDKYPEVMFGVSDVKFLDGKFGKDDKSISDICYRIDLDKRVIYVEKETPRLSVESAILRATVELWQYDNELLISYADAHTCFEELLFLEHSKLLDRATAISEKFDEYLKADVEEIKAYVFEGTEEEKRTSFSFMREKISAFNSECGGEDPIVETDPVGLYDPNKIPRFWKRFLRGQSVTEGEDKLSTDERTEEEIPEENTEETGEVASTEE